jgi:CHAT domain-containing protein
MARTSTPDPRWIVALLALVLTSASAVSPEREAYRKAETLWNRGDWRAAEPFLRRSLTQINDKDSDDAWEMRLWLSDALIAQSKNAEAADVLARKLPARLGHRSVAVRYLLQRAMLEIRLNNNDGAESLLAKAEVLAETYQPLLLADVFGRRAVIATSRRDFDEAEENAQKSIRRARRQHDRLFEINALATLGRLRTLQSRYDEAVAYHQQALALASEAGMRSKIEKLSGNLGWTQILLGDFDGALETLTNSLAIAESIGAEYDTVPCLDNLGSISVHNHDYRKALAYYQKAVLVARRISHRDLAEFLANTAVALMELGDPAGARKANDEGRALIDPKDNSKQLRALLIDARIDAQTGQIDSAIAKTRHVIESAKTKSQRWEAQARLAQFYVVANKASDAETNFRRAIETAADARDDIKKEELRLSFGALVREANEDYVRFLLSTNRVPAALQVTESSRAQTLDEALGKQATLRPFDPKRIARDRGAVILSYWLTPKQSYVWTISSSSIEVETLPPAKTIEDAIDSYTRDIQALRTGEASRARAARLYSMLVPPALTRASLPRGARIIVVPDGRLHAFNLEALVNPASKQYWIEDVTIETASSLDLLENSPASPAPQSMLLVGDPPSPAREFPRLMNAADEMTRVKKHFPNSTTVLEGSHATRSAYEIADAGHFACIHFVAHGIATRQRPLDSAVILAREGDSYKLYARDILKHPLRARLVTISSCHGAGTRAYTGEGLVGLAWAFLHAGARQVIAALWEVNDRATPQLMDDLYAGIQGGHDPATALRDAKLNLIRRGGINSQPRYWAPFVLYSGS